MHRGATKDEGTVHVPYGNPLWVTPRLAVYHGVAPQELRKFSITGHIYYILSKIQLILSRADQRGLRGDCSIGVNDRRNYKSM